MLHEEELMVEVKLVTTLYADGEVVLVIEEVLERVNCACSRQASPGSVPVVARARPQAQACLR